ncbi:MAG: glycosyltransferase [Geobacteraceae bacterium]|nr:glycosyltransferase [Geobacteraceae bacterium]
MISVIIPIYNGEEYISQAIESIMSQTFHNFELIIIDDGSTDGTRLICEGYSIAHPDLIRYFYQNNKGVSAARNYGVRMAAGEFIAFLDGDDMADKNWLMNLMAGFTDEDIVVSAGKTTCCSFSDSLIQSILSQNSSFDEDFTDRSLVKEFMICCAMFRKHAFEGVGGFDETLPYGSEDNDLTYRLNLADKKIIYIADAVVHYRPRTTIRMLMRQRYLYGKSKILLYKKHKLLQKNIAQDLIEFTQKSIKLLVRSFARIIKFIFNKNRNSALLLEHPLSILCLVANQCGRIVGRIKYSG